MFEEYHQKEREIENKVAPFYDSIYESLLCYLERRKKFVKNIKEITRGEKNMRILDLGCGTGTLLFVLQKEGYQELFGIDLSPNMVKIAKKRLNDANLKVGFAENTGFPDNFFDLVVGISILHHIPNLKKVSREMSRILKKGGRILFMEPNKDWFFENKKGLTQRILKVALLPLKVLVYLKNKNKKRRLPQITQDDYSPHHRHLKENEIKEAFEKEFRLRFHRSEVIIPFFESWLFLTFFDKLILNFLNFIEKSLEKNFIGLTFIISGNKKDDK